LAVKSAGNTFSASWRGSRGCDAKYKMPIAPAPSAGTMAYPANTWPPTSDMGKS
jgi:hypothetical protein